MRVQATRRWLAVACAAAIAAAVAPLAAGQPGTAAPASPKMHINCATGKPVCVEVHDSEQVFGEEVYVGHDEPATLFYDNRAGSGNDNTYFLRLPKDPPRLTDAAYTEAFKEVKQVGAANSKTRTKDQTEIAHFWADGPGTCTPPGHWNEIAQTVARQRGTTLAENARLFALLHLALADYRHLLALIAQAEAALDRLAAADPATRLLETAPGVGPRTAEAVAAHLGDPKRFASGKQVSAYDGLVPRQYQSGESDRKGRITRRGPGVLRKLLVECAWASLRYNAWARATYARLTRGGVTRKKPAVVALARRLLVRLWAMLRDEAPWRAGPAPAAA